MYEPYRYFTQHDFYCISSTDNRKIKRARAKVVKRMAKHCDSSNLGDCVVLYENLKALKNSRKEAKANRRRRFTNPYS